MVNIIDPGYILINSYPPKQRGVRPGCDLVLYFMFIRDSFRYHPGSWVPRAASITLAMTETLDGTFYPFYPGIQVPISHFYLKHLSEIFHFLNNYNRVIQMTPLPFCKVFLLPHNVSNIGLWFLCCSESRHWVITSPICSETISVAEKFISLSNHYHYWITLQGLAIWLSNPLKYTDLIFQSFGIVELVE